MNTNISITGVIRNILTAVGGYLLGKNLFGLAVNESLWQELTGVIMGIISVIWSIKEKNVTIEMFQGVIRNTVGFLGGIFVGFGKITGDTLALVLALIVPASQLIYSGLSRLKSQHIDEGKIKVEQLKK